MLRKIASRVVFLLTFIPLFLLAFAYLRYLESQHRADSLGLWYTSLSALIFSGPPAMVLASVHWWFSRRAG